MGLFKRRGAVGPTDDVAEARELRAEAVEQRSMMAGAVSYIAARRKENGFGDELQVTWTPRREEIPSMKERHA